MGEGLRLNRFFCMCITKALLLSSKFSLTSPHLQTDDHLRKHLSDAIARFSYEMHIHVYYMLSVL